MLRSYTLAIVALAGAALTLALVQHPLTRVMPILVLGILASASEHQRVRLPNGVVVSPGFMVGMTAIVVLRSSSPIAGPMLVGLMMGVHIHDLVRGRRAWILFNAATFALGTGAAALVFSAMPERLVEPLPLGIAAVIPAALTVVFVESVVVALSYWFESRTSVLRSLVGAAPAIAQVVPFALVGLFLGRLYRDLGWPVALMLFVPVLLMRGVFTSYLELRATNEATMQVLVRALESKDAYTAGHAERVAIYARYIGEELHLMPWRLDRMRAAALMHDIGKLVVPNQLLNKPGRLTANEFAVVRRHERVSVAMLSHIDFLRPIAPVVSGDHSHFGAARNSGSMEAFAIAVADAYDAMTSTRSYRRALPQAVALEELRNKAGTQFHPGCVEALARAITRHGVRHGAGYENDCESWLVAPPYAGLGSAGLGDLAEGLERA